MLAALATYLPCSALLLAACLPDFSLGAGLSPVTPEHPFPAQSRLEKPDQCRVVLRFDLLGYGYLNAVEI